MLEIVVQPVFVPQDPGPEVGLVAVQGRGAKLELFTDGSQGGAVQEGLVDFLAVGGDYRLNNS